MMYKRKNKLKTISNSKETTQNKFFTRDNQDYSQVSDASLIDYKNKLQSQISTIKAADIFDTSTRYTILNQPSTLFSSIVTGKASPVKSSKKSIHNEYISKFMRSTGKSFKSGKTTRSRQKYQSGIGVDFMGLEQQRTPRFSHHQFVKTKSILRRRPTMKKSKKR